MPKKDDKDDVVVPLSRFRRAREEAIPELHEAPAPPSIDAGLLSQSKAAVDLSGRPKIWCLLSSNGGGKTTYARWLNFAAIAMGNEGPLLAALDPGNRSLASWFADVQQPPNRDTKNSARWLRDYLDFVVDEKKSAILDFGGGGETALAEVVSSHPDLVASIETAGASLVACYPLTPRVTDIFVAKGFEDAGFQPSATLLLLNEGRADPTRPAAESFDDIIRHSAFRNMVARGAQVVWMPALDSDIIKEIEGKQLTFDMARDGRVPEGATFWPIGGLRRSAVGRWMALMGIRHEGIKTWML